MFFKTKIFEISTLKNGTTVQLVQPYRGRAGTLDSILCFYILKKHIGVYFVMTEENFFDMFNRVHNPDYYYGRKKTKEKKTKKKKTYSRKPTKRFPVFKV